MVTVVVMLGIISQYAFTVLNGIHDGCNVIATIIASRSMDARKALLIACIAEVIGPLFIGTAVAATIGKGVIKFSFLSTPGDILSSMTILAAIIGAIAWNLFTWKMGIPSSSSHALIGGLLGAGLVAFGIEAIDWFSLITKVILVMFTSPLIGFAAGYIIMRLSLKLLINSHPSINDTFKKIQPVTMILLGTNHGSSDGQKAAGIITLLLIIGGFQKDFIVPAWVLLSSTVALVIGISLGGWKIVKTVGTGIYKVKPVHSFNVQLTSVLVIFIANLMGAPVSTTHVVSSSVMGVGTAERANSVKWYNVKNILLSWVITIPASGIISILCFYILKISLM